MSIPKNLEAQPLPMSYWIRSESQATCRNCRFYRADELSSWSFYRACIAEFVATFLFLYITVLTVKGVVKSSTKCSTVGIQGIAWAFGGTIFALVYCTAGISVFLVHPATIPITGPGINPARSLGTALICNKDKAWDDHWIFWVGPFVGAALYPSFLSSFNLLFSFSGWK